MAIYYVSPTGNDSNAGTSAAAPFLTTSKACSLAVAGDAVEYLPGTYTSGSQWFDSQSFTIPSGTSFSNAITFRAYQRGTVIFQGSSPVRLTTNTPHYLIFQDVTFDGNLTATETVFIDGGHHVRFQRCTEKNATTFGIHTGPTSTGCEYLQCVIRDNGTIGAGPTNGHGMYITSSDALIDGCEITGNRGYGVHCYNNTTPYLTGAIIRNNRIHGNGLNGGSTYGILVAYYDSPLIEGNLVYGQTTAGAGGILVYSHSKAALVYRNTITACNAEGIALQFYETAPTIRGNIVYGNGSAIVDYGGTGTPTIDHNVTADPSFVNAGANNYALQSGSAARGANIAIGAVTTDYMGTTIASPYDCGAYQYRAGTLIADGMNLQTALSAAAAGATLILQAGRQFVGNFTLPVHSGSSAITVQSACDLPAVGVRVSPTSAANYAVLVPAAGGGAALATVDGAHDWSLVGLTLINTPSAVNDILQLGDGSSAQTTLAQVPYNLTVDRCYIRGDPTYGQKRGIALNSGTSTITNNYISDIKAVGQDSEAIAGWNGPGPYTIDNNYLEAAGVNVLFGGAATYIPLNIPSDITVTNNTVAKPLAWRSEGWQVKNLFELKAAVRWVVDSNTFDYSWAGAQAGHTIVLTVRNSDYTPPTINNYWSTIATGLFSRNTIRHGATGMQILGHEDTGAPSGTMTSVIIRDNVFWDISESYNGSGRWLETQYGDQISLVHNTVITTQTYSDAVLIALINHPITNFVHQNNIIVNPQGGGPVLVRTFTDDALNGLIGTAALAALASPYTFSSNVIIGGTSSGYPSGNFYPATIADVGFTNASTNDYRLLASSPYHNAGSDGMDIGARFANAPAPGSEPPPPLPDPPSAPSNPTPANGATAVGTSQRLSWNLASNATTYTVDFGTVNPPPTVSTGQTATTYTPTLTTSTTYYWKITAVGAGGSTAGSVWSFTTAAAPAPPGTPTTPNPATAATNVATSQVLSWNPTSNTLTYAVKFGTANPPPLVVSSQAGTSYAPTLAYSSTYYWQVTATGTGGSATGAVWSFTTVAAPPPPPPPPILPGPPSNPSPVDTATGVPINPSLAWTSTNATSYDVAFGTTNPPATVTTGQGAASYTPSLLAYSTTYYWKIIAHTAGGSATGAVWSFTTRAVPSPPPTPVPGAPTGPTPTNTATGVAPHATLSWSADNATSYAVAFGTANPPPSVSVSQVSPHYTLDGLAFSTLYRWQITAINDSGRTDGPVWSFTTAAASPGIIIGGSVGTLMPWVKPTFFDPRSNKVSYANGGKLYFYVTRTTTLLATFSDVGLTVPNVNPIILNSAGQSPTSIFLQATGYTVVLTDHNGVQLWSIDDVEAINAAP